MIHLIDLFLSNILDPACQVPILSESLRIRVAKNIDGNGELPLDHQFQIRLTIDMSTPYLTEQHSILYCLFNTISPPAFSSWQRSRMVPFSLDSALILIAEKEISER